VFGTGTNGIALFSFLENGSAEARLFRSRPQSAGCRPQSISRKAFERKRLAAPSSVQMLCIIYLLCGAGITGRPFQLRVMGVVATPKSPLSS